MRIPLLLARVILIAVMALPACSKDNGDASASAPVARPKTAPNFSSPWQTETEYVVTRIVSELAGFIDYANHRAATPSAPGSPTVTLTTLRRDEAGPVFHVRVALAAGKGAEFDLPLDTGIFSVETYLPAIASLQAATGAPLQAEAEPVSTDPETALLQDRAEGLQAMDRTLSRQLEAHFNDPALHEQAALLIEAFSWRDCSGKFFNLLPELARITAHRAFAAALRRGAPGGSRTVLTGGLQDALIDAEAAAVTAAGALPAQGPFPAWSRVIRIRATGDYRIFESVGAPTLIERVEWFRTFSATFGTEAALGAYTIPDELASLPDWWRILNNSSPSVDTGHRLLDCALASELQEAAAACAAYGPQASRDPAVTDQAAVIAALNAPEVDTVQADASGPATVQVLGWNLWAQFLQREVCFAVAGDFDFLQCQWGVPDRAKAYAAVADQSFHGLALYPLVRRLDSTEEAYYHSAQDDAMRLVRSSPERVPAGAWNEISAPPGFCPFYVPPPHPFINEWHRDNPLPGTVYDLYPRLFHPSLMNRPNIAGVLDQLGEMAPYSVSLMDYRLHARYGNGVTAEEAIAVYGPVLDFDPLIAPYIARLFGDRKDRTHQEEWLKRAASTNPAAYQELAHMYRDTGREAEAADAYARWMASPPDPVAAANDSYWLIEYYEHHGRGDDATALADRAATVYSYKGLYAKARLLEERKEYDDALTLYRDIDERYDAPSPTIGFLLRHQDPDGGPIEPALLARMLAAHFPSGLQKLDPAKAVRPRVGVLVDTTNANVAEARLRVGDIIVGMRGYVVEDWADYLLLRDLDPEAPYAISIWRKDRLITLQPLEGGYRFGLDFPDYPAQNRVSN